MEKIDKITFVCAVLCLIFKGFAQAEEIELSKIVVTPSRIEESSGDSARSVDVITSTQMERTGTEDLSDALTGLTSVDISDYGGLGADKNIRMRGSTAAQVLVLMDGRPISNPRDGQVDLTTIPLDQISRVEVMHGPGSSLYGSSAMGGVVNIITKDPPRKGQTAELYSSFGTYRTYIERALFGANAGKFGFLTNGGYQRTSGYRVNSDFDASDFNLKFNYDINDYNKLNLNSGFYKSRAGAPGSLTYPDPDDRQNILKRFFDFSWNFRPDEKTSFSTRAYQNYDRLEFMENAAEQSWEIAGKKDTHTTTVRGLNLQLARDLTNIDTLVAGFDQVKNMNDSTTSSKHNYDVTAGYLENRLKLFDKKLETSVSLRVDDYSNFGTQVNPGLSLLYKFSPNASFHGSVNRSFRAPTFNDLYWPDEGWAKGNPDLSPEKGVTEEVGADFIVNSYLNSGLTYFHSDYKDLIQWSDNGSGVYQPENVSSAVIDGLELQNKIFLSSSLDLDLNYTYLMARDKETHKYLVYQPANKLDFCLKYHDAKGFIFEIKGQYTAQRFADAANNEKVKDFFILGVNASKKFRHGVTCFAYINNLLNRKYQVIQGYPMPGFSFTGGAKIEF